ncbi:MAG: DsbC family protein [Rubrivivax sp.]|nr:DsbC family protein [Rubrivivax sp.]
MTSFRPALAALISAVLCTLGAGLAQANEAVIRKNLAERMPNLPKIDEVQRTPVNGLWEVRIGTDILYTDADGQFILQGELFDTKSRQNLTQQRIDKLTAFDFPNLPFRDAIVFKQGTGARKLAVFADPNCGYCKRFERDIASLKDVTVYNFLYPILGPDSDAKSRDIWCAKDRGKAWRDWMLEGKLPPKAEAGCDSQALTRNVALGKKHRVQGTPAAVLEDGARLPGAVPLDQLERRVAAASKG